MTVRHQAYVFEAIFKMAKNNIHHLAVVNEEQKLIGVINAIDLLSQQTRSPLYLTQEMEAAESIEELKEINGRILDMVRSAMGCGSRHQKPGPPDRPLQRWVHSTHHHPHGPTGRHRSPCQGCLPCARQ